MKGINKLAGEENASEKFSQEKRLAKENQELARKRLKCPEVVLGKWCNSLRLDLADTFYLTPCSSIQGITTALSTSAATREFFLSYSLAKPTFV